VGFRGSYKTLLSGESRGWYEGFHWTKLKHLPVPLGIHTDQNNITLGVGEMEPVGT